jgi:TonB family protein
MKNKPWFKYLPLIGGGLLVLIVAIVVYVFRDAFEKPARSKKQVQQITVVRLPPPPPPPPVQKPPEPEVKEEKIEEPDKQPEPEPEKEPDPAPEQADEPAGDQLGVDGEGGAGSDAFGLAARKGGRSLLGGTTGSVIHWYGGQIRRVLESELPNLLSDTHASKHSYAVILNIWIGPDGRLSRAELASSSGKPEVDEALRTAIPKLQFALEKPPPANMPQPVKIRLNARI